MEEKAYTIQRSEDYGMTWYDWQDGIKSVEDAKKMLEELRVEYPKKNKQVKFRIDEISDNAEKPPSYSNKVEYIGHYGGDITHGLSAWTSTYRDLTNDKLERLPKMLAYLAEHKHETPFEKSVQHFLVDTEIASHIHLLKHRIGVSINAESARYKELNEDKFYVPEDFHNVPISPEHSILGNYNNWAEVLIDLSTYNNRLYHACLKDVEKVYGRKRAKESARFFKMYNSQICSDVMFNWRSFAHFIYLRRTEMAQREICVVADKMLDIIKNLPGEPFKYTIEAFGM
jgi:flavin-dependent thymidylate synthase